MSNAAALARGALVGMGLHPTARRVRYVLRHYVELPLRYAGANEATLDALLDGTALPHSVVSFDVFDTAVTRAWFRPADVFLVAGLKLAAENLFAGEPDDWEKLRLQAETAARTKRRGEIELPSIYEWLAPRLGWAVPDTTRAMQIEREVEAASMRPIARIATAIDAGRDRGIDVIFLSDTYLDQQFIERQLVRIGVADGESRVYVSSASERTKGNGKLFDYVLAAQGIAAGQMVHIGDNRHSDVDRATRAGICACYFRQQSPTRYERAYHRHPGPRLLRSATAGAARAARLSQWYRAPRLQTIHEVGCAVAGPMLAGYVLWVLLEARKRALKRLYFISRDGQILLLIAQRLCRAFAIDIDCRYLFGSRRAFALPAAARRDDIVRLLTDDCAGKSLRSVLARVEIEPKAVAAMLEPAGFPATSWDARLASADVSRLDALCRDDRFVGMVLDQAESRRAVLLDYLQRVGLLDDVPAGLVDLGWRGRLQRWLCAVVRADGLDPCFTIAGFYFGLRERFPPSLWGEQIVYAQPPYPAEVLLEAFAVADHPSVARFVRSGDGTVHPGFAEQSPTEAGDDTVRVIQDAAVAFVDEMIASATQIDATPEAVALFLGDAAKAPFAMFERAPTPAEAEAFGTMHFSGDHVHANSFPIAPRLARGEMMKLYAAAYGSRLKYTQWMEGSIVRSVRPRERFILLRLWFIARRVGGRLRRTVKRKIRNGD